MEQFREACRELLLPELVLLVQQYLVPKETFLRKRRRTAEFPSWSYYDPLLFQWISLDNVLPEMGRDESRHSSILFFYEAAKPRFWMNFLKHWWVTGSGVSVQEAEQRHDWKCTMLVDNKGQLWKCTGRVRQAWITTLIGPTLTLRVPEAQMMLDVKAIVITREEVFVWGMDAYSWSWCLQAWNFEVGSWRTIALPSYLLDRADSFLVRGDEQSLSWLSMRENVEQFHLIFKTGTIQHDKYPSPDRYVQELTVLSRLQGKLWDNWCFIPYPIPSFPRETAILHQLT
jgi:hypothetical protein